MMVKRKAFDMSNPQEIIPGSYMVRLTIASEYLDFVNALPYIADVEDFTSANRDLYHVWIDRRYDVDEAWLDMYEQLAAESAKTELSDVWKIEE